MDFSKFLASDYNENVNAKRINKDLIYNIRKEKLSDYIIKALKVLECKYIKIKDWKVITDESKFDPNKINSKYIKNNKNKKFDKRIPINNSRYDLLVVDFLVTLPETTYVKTVELLLLKPIDNFYYILDGNRYYPIYQLVDSSVYNRKDYLIMKTHSGPIIYKRGSEDIMDVNGEVYKVPTYKLCIYKQRLNSLLFFYALMGFENTMKYMQMDDIIRIETFKDYNEDEEYCFLCNGGIYVKVIKYFFDNDNFTRNMTHSVIETVGDFNSVDEVKDTTHTQWGIELGKVLIKSDVPDDKRFVKGNGFLLSFANMQDQLTKDGLYVKSFNKRSVFAMLRWILRNFNELKAKHNMDIKNKRIRLHEYMAYYLIVRLNQRKRKFISIMSSGNGITVDNVEDLLNMDRDFLLKSITGSKSSLMKYDNSVNDLDMFVSLKYSLKGPNSIGEKSSNSVNIKQRDIDESYIGIIDVNSTSNSDPKYNGVVKLL